MSLRRKIGARQLLDVEKDTVRDVSAAEFREEYERKQRVYEPGMAPVKTIRLWDNIDNAWTSALPRKEALEFNVNMVVARCSVCTETSSGIGGHARDIPNHFKRIKDNAEDHSGDVQIIYLPTASGAVTPSCTACGRTFRSRPHLATKHLREILDNARLHEGAVEQTVKRFSLEPPVLAFPDTRKGDARPELQQVERSPQRRRRKRSRGQKRELVHG